MIMIAFVQSSVLEITFESSHQFSKRQQSSAQALNTISINSVRKSLASLSIGIHHIPAADGGGGRASSNESRPSSKLYTRLIPPILLNADLMDFNVAYTTPGLRHPASRTSTLFVVGWASVHGVGYKAYTTGLFCSCFSSPRLSRFLFSLSLIHFFDL